MASKGLLKSKKRLFADEPAMPERPKSVHIREAENGFVVTCSHPGKDEDKISKSIPGVLKILKEYFGESESYDEKEDE